MATTAATLVLKVITDTKDAAGGLDKVAKSTTSFKDKVGAAAKVAGGVLLGLGAAAVAAGKAAAEDAQSQALLAQSMKNSAGASKEQIAATEDWISKTTLATGVADDKLRPALANLVRATGDVSLSQKDMAIALDISAATGKDVTAVTAAMAKGYGGSTTALNKMLPAVAGTAAHAKDFNDVIEKAGKITKGSMAASANSAAGEMERMKVSMSETTETLGAALLPIMSKFAQVAAKVAQWVGKNSTAFQIIVGVIAAVAAAIVVLNGVLTVCETVTTLVGLAAEHAWIAALGPIGLVIAAVAAVVVVFVILYKKSKTFRDFVNKMWATVKDGARTAAAIFKSVWNAAVAVVKGYFQAYKAAIVLVFNIIRGVVRAVAAVFRGDWRGAVDAVKGIFRAFGDFFRSLWNALPGPVQRLISKIIGGLGHAIQWLMDKMSGLGDILRAPFDVMLDAINGVIGVVRDLIGWISKIKIPDVGGALGKLNPFSAVAPSPSVGPSVGSFGAPRVLSGGAAASTMAVSPGVTIQVNGALDPEAVARQIQRILNGHERRIGLRSA